MIPPRSVAPGSKIFLANKKRIRYYVQWRWLALAPWHERRQTVDSLEYTLAASGRGPLVVESTEPLGGAEVHLCNQIARRCAQLGFPNPNPIPNGNPFFYSVDLLVRRNCSRHIPMCRQPAHPNGAAAFLSSNWRKFESRSVAPHLNPSTSNALRRPKGESSSFASML